MCFRSDLSEETAVLACRLYKYLNSDVPVFPACNTMKVTQNVESKIKSFTKLSTTVITLHIHKLSAVSYKCFLMQNIS